MTPTEYQTHIQASKEVFRLPLNLLEKRDELFDRQLQIIDLVGSGAVRGTFRVKDKLRAYGKKMLIEEYRFNQIQLKNLDKDISQRYEYKIIEEKNYKNKDTLI